MSSTEKIENLKAELMAEISKENSDNNVILSLSQKIANLDSENVRFSVDAGIINRLGKELVGRHETAVSELVKNAYDADATDVQLIFVDAFNKGGKLIIKDDGIGMTKSQLINGFMRLSSSDKIHFPKSPKYKRTRAGKKGIGRFATQRLGNVLTIITQTFDSDEAIKVTIDWNRYETDQDLSIIANKIEVIAKQKTEGTDLIIEDLREGWSDVMIKRVYRYTADLLQPFPLSKKKKNEKKNEVDPGFSTSYFRDVNGTLNKIIDEQEAFLKNALAEIEGFVLDNGQGCWTLQSNRLGFKEQVFDIGRDEKDDKSPFEFIRDIHFKCYYFIYENDLLSPQLKTFIRDVSYEHGGLRLYRNGFRVLPYGEKGNDWLLLDESARRRNILPGHANNNFFGFVEITDEAGINYEETSSREGLIENEAFKELTDFIYRSIIGAVLKIAELRGRKGKTSQKNWKGPLTPTEVVDTAIDKLKHVFEENFEHETKEEGSTQNNDSGNSDQRNEKEKFQEAYEELLEARAEEKKDTKNLIEENNMLRILAGLGLVIGEFVHEVKRFLPAFDVDTKFLKLNTEENPTLHSRITRLESNIKSFSSYTSYFDRAISRNVLRELQPIELRDAINDFIDVIENELKRTKIILDTSDVNGFELLTTPMHPSEWASILFNLYTNSKKAIRRQNTKGRIKIKAGRDGKGLFLEFSDNGDGIPKENEENIFNAFFTTSSASGHSAADSDILTGTGLGLKILHDIIESYGGDIFVTSPEESYTTTIRIEIPENKI